LSWPDAPESAAFSKRAAASYSIAWNEIYTCDATGFELAVSARLLFTRKSVGRLSHRANQSFDDVMMNDQGESAEPADAEPTDIVCDRLMRAPSFVVDS
jgi:hypothetical protein